jgi:hypothetical protein
VHICFEDVLVRMMGIRFAGSRHRSDLGLCPLTNMNRAVRVRWVQAVVVEAITMIQNDIMYSRIVGIHLFTKLLSWYE